MTQPIAPSITVAGNVEGSIVVGDNNFVVNTNNGTIVYQQAAPRVQLRGAIPQPPRKPRTFIGRARELAELESHIAASEPVILAGPDGLGKTSLAKQAANGPAARSQPNGVIFLEGVDETGATLGFGDLIQRLFDAAYESEPQLKVDLASARTYLSNLRPLVFLSAVELSDANLGSLADLFPNAPILVDGESAPPGDVFAELELGPLAREDSLALLAERSGLPLDATTHTAFDELAAILTDIPAALVSLGSAVRAKRLTVDDALVRLRRVAPNTAETAGAAVERAYLVVLSTLSEDERRMLVQAGAAPGISVDRKWLEKTCGGKPVSERLEALQLLQANSPRLRLMPGLGKLALAGADLSAAREQLLGQLLGQVAKRALDFDFVRDELGNLLGLLNWAASEGRWQESVALGRGLDPYLTLAGLWDAWGSVLRNASQAALALGDKSAQGWALHQLGTRQIGLGDYAAAEGLLEQALSIRQELGDETGAAHTQHNLDFLSAMASQSSTSTAGGGRGRLQWILGGVIGLILLALCVGTVIGLRRPATETPSSTATATATPTRRPSRTSEPSLTTTATGTPALTSTPAAAFTAVASPTATFVPLMNAVLREHAYCFDGPDRLYLYYYGMLQGMKVQATGRNDDGSWVYVQIADFEKPGNFGRCWFAAQSLSLEGNVMELQPIYPDIVGPPISGNPVGYPHLSNVKTTRNGNLVTISWTGVFIPPGDRESATSPLYLLELWTCQNGKVSFTPHFLYTESFTATDEPGCADSSHGRVFLSEKHGYIGPEVLQWPAASVAPISPTLTPTP